MQKGHAGCGQDAWGRLEEIRVIKFFHVNGVIMKDKKKSCKSQSDNTENNNSNQKQGEIYKELYIINISIWGVFLILYGIIINIE